jgi:hypothetical protein
LCREVALRLGNRHQPAHVQPRQRGHRLRQHGRLIGNDATLAELAADVDLQTHLQGRQPIGAQCRQPLGDLQSIDRVHPVEAFGDDPGLVALQRSDQVPLDLAAQIGQRFHLFEGFLHVVLAERALPGRVRVAHRLWAESLCHSQQRDALHGTLRGLARGRDTRAHLL